MDKPFLSIIIPAYNEARRLPHTLEQVYRFVQTQSYDVEVLVVENGSQDDTYKIARDFAATRPQFFALQESARGKGLAVQRGMFQARGHYRFMCDADLSMPLDQINRFLPPNLTEFDLAIASREAPGSVRYKEPLYRHLGGRAINLIIRLLALPGLHDTQCGFKCFHHLVAEDLFSCQTLTNWSFDIELLYIARLRHYRVVEIPIPWYFNPESKLNVFQDAFRMVLDIVRIRQNARSGLYKRQQESGATGV